MSPQAPQISATATASAGADVRDVALRAHADARNVPFPGRKDEREVDAVLAALNDAGHLDAGHLDAGHAQSEAAREPREFVAHLRSRADRFDARAGGLEPGDTLGGAWQLREAARRDRATADDLERFLDEGVLP